MSFTTTSSCSFPGSFSYSLANATQEFESNTAPLLQESRKDVLPLEVLPPPMQSLLQQLAERYKFPLDYSLLYLLFVFSVAIGNKFRLLFKKHWVEPATLYLALVAPAGQSKTPVQAFFTAPFKEQDLRHYNEYIEEMKSYEAAKQAATKKNPCLLPKPARKQLLVQDYTPEALIKVLGDNWHGVGVQADELAGFFGNMNRYNNGNEVPTWLSFYNAQSVSINRKTTLDSYVPYPFVSVIGGIQPGILKKLFSGDMQINGMFDRFLYVYNVDVKKELPTDDEVDPDLVNAYTKAVDHLLQIEPQKDVTDSRSIPMALKPTPEAKTLLIDYLGKNADEYNKLNEEGAERLAGMTSKFDYHAIRLSLILQTMIDACNSRDPVEVTAEAVQGGIRLAEYFKTHSRRVQSLISGDPLAALNEEKKAFYRQLPDGPFSFSQAVTLATVIRNIALPARTIKSDTVEKWTQRFLKNRTLFSYDKAGHYSKKHQLPS